MGPHLIYLCVYAMYIDVEIMQICLGKQVHLITKNQMFSRMIPFTA